jgi:hypothetical protein
MCFALVLVGCFVFGVHKWLGLGKPVGHLDAL